MFIGSHVNFNTEQLLGCAKQAASFGATTFMFYTGAPQNTMRRSIEEEKTKEAISFMKENGISLEKVICHAPYIINLANKSKSDAWDFSIKFLRQEIARITEMNVGYIVVHPGNSLTMDRREALKNIADALNFVIDEDTKPMVLLETMAGKGTECGTNIDELKYIINNVKHQEKLGVCLDTCHLNDSGIDIKEIDDYLKEFDEKIGIDKIKCVHVNDSKNELGSHKDRHANIGYGTIGFDTLLNVIYLDKLKDVPKILETPWIEDYPPYKFELEMIKSKTFNPNLEENVKDYYNNEPNF